MSSLEQLVHRVERKPDDIAAMTMLADAMADATGAERIALLRRWMDDVRVATDITSVLARIGSGRRPERQVEVGDMTVIGQADEGEGPALERLFQMLSIEMHPGRAYVMESNLSPVPPGWMIHLVTIDKE